MCRQVVHDDEVTHEERGHQMLPNVIPKEWTIHGSVDHQRRGQSGGAQRGQEGGRLPVTMGNLGDQPLAFERTAPQAGHVGFHPRFVEKDEPSDVEATLLEPERRSAGGDVGAILLGRAVISPVSRRRCFRRRTHAGLIPCLIDTASVPIPPSQSASTAFRVANGIASIG
jgi:hypothetical protein